MGGKKRHPAGSDSPSPKKGSPVPASPPSTLGRGGEAETVDRCLVYCRLRPSHEKDFEDGGFPLLTMRGKSVAVHDERSYEYDGSFGDSSTQEEIFNSVGVPCLKHALKGFCSALMCYGQTGTGKSYTMCCTASGSEGIIPRAANYLFDTAAKETGKHFTFTGQFVQIYRDQLGDLMTEGGKDRVDIRFGDDDGVTLPGCTSHELNSAEEFMNFYEEGNQRRVVVATAMNPESSRGHTALVLWVRSKGNDDTETRGKITFIDLAGYERFSKTGISGKDPIRKDEAKTINASLLSLGHVVSSLSNGDKHIPWRNAKLTRLLQDSIGGRSRTSIILTVGPSSEHLHETTNSLQFGMRAMAVKVESKMSVVTDYQGLAAKLQAMLDEKDKQIGLLELQVSAGEGEREELIERHRRDEEQLRQRHAAETKELKKAGASEERILRMEAQQAVESENLQEEQREEAEYQQELFGQTMKGWMAMEKEGLGAAQLAAEHEELIKDLEEKITDVKKNTKVAVDVNVSQLLTQCSVRKEEQVQSEAEVAKMEDQLKAFCHQMADSTEDDLAAEISEIRHEFESEAESLRTQLKEKTGELEIVKLSETARQEKIDQLQKELEDRTNEIAEASVSVNEKTLLQKEVDELAKNNERLQEELETTKNSVKDLQQVNSATTSLAKKRVVHLSEQLAVSEGTIARLRKIVENSSKEGPTATQGAHSAEMDALSEELKAVMHSQKQQLSGTLAMVVTLEQALQTSNGRCRALEHYVRELQNQIKTLGAAAVEGPPAPMVFEGVSCCTKLPLKITISPLVSDADSNHPVVDQSKVQVVLEENLSESGSDVLTGELALPFSAFRGKKGDESKNLEAQVGDVQWKTSHGHRLSARWHFDDLEDERMGLAFLPGEKTLSVHRYSKSNSKEALKVVD